MRTLSSIKGRKVETHTGRALGRCHDLRGELTGSKLHDHRHLRRRKRAWLAHLGIRSHRRHEVVPWADVIRIEGKRIVVRDDRDRRSGSS